MTVRPASAKPTDVSLLFTGGTISFARMGAGESSSVVVHEEVIQNPERLKTLTLAFSVSYTSQAALTVFLEVDDEVEWSRALGSTHDCIFSGSKIKGPLSRGGFPMSMIVMTGGAPQVSLKFGIKIAEECVRYYDELLKAKTVPLEITGIKIIK